MCLNEILVLDAIIPALTAGNRDGVIREIVESLRAAHQLANVDTDEIVRAILRRETLGSTGIGRGVAIPHTKHAGVKRPIGTIAISETGVPFDSLDGEPVHVFVLLISPQDRAGDHLRALENVSRTLRDDGFVRALRNARTRQRIWKILERERNHSTRSLTPQRRPRQVNTVHSRVIPLQEVAPTPPLSSCEVSVAPVELPERSHLIAPHRCEHCAGELPATGRRRTTRLDCPHCHKNTSVYALVHRCPGCDALLESPLRQRGSRGRCPACGDHLTIPSDLLFNDDRETPDHTWFVFCCPNCQQELRSPSAGANRTAICCHCLRTLTIPTGGERAVAPPASAEGLPSFQPDVLRRCPRCGLQVAARARICRNCDARFA